MAPLKLAFSAPRCIPPYRVWENATQTEKMKPRCKRVARLRKVQRGITVDISTGYRTALQNGQDCNAKCNAHLDHFFQF